MRLLVAGLLAGLFLTVAAGAEPSAGFDFYRGFLEKTAAADSLDDILPFMPDWWRDRYASDPERGAAALERLRSSSQNLRNVELEKEEASGSGFVLHMKARDPNDLPMKGKVTLVEEGGSLRVEESMWATAQ